MSPGQTNTKPDKAELEAAIDALLKDIDTTCSRFENPAQALEDDELAEYTRAAEAANKARSANQPTPEAAPATPAEPSAQPLPEEVSESAERAIVASAAGMNTLLEEAADRLIESLEQEMAPAVPSEPEAAIEPEAAAEAESEPEPTDEPDTATVTEPTDGTFLTERALDSLLAETPEAEPEAAVEPTVAEETPTPVDTAETVTPEPMTPEPTRDVFADLDAAFDDLLDGTFETADGQAVDTDGVDTSPDRTLMLDSATPSIAAPSATPATPPSPEPVAPNATAPAAAEAAAPTTETSTAQASVTPVDATREVAPKSRPVSVPAKKTKGRRLAAALDGLWLRVRPLLVGTVRGVVDAVRPLGARALIVLSRPLDGKPPQVRDSIGWVALWTLFLAVCVWAYAMLRPAPVPPNDGRASAVVTPETPLDP